MSFPFICRTATTQDAAASPSIVSAAAVAAVLALVMAAKRGVLQPSVRLRPRSSLVRSSALLDLALVAGAPCRAPAVHLFPGIRAHGPARLGAQLQPPRLITERALHPRTPRSGARAPWPHRCAGSVQAWRSPRRCSCLCELVTRSRTRRAGGSRPARPRPRRGPWVRGRGSGSSS